MRKLPIVTAVLALPATAVAAGGPFDLLGSVVQTVASLALVIGIILIIYHFAGRLMKLSHGGSAANRYIRVLETRHLSPKKSLMLVEVGGEYLLLSNSGDGVNFLSKLELLEEIEVVEEKSASSLIPGRLKERVAGMLQELPLSLVKKNGGLA
ncbi:flagellar biosynthetic protein FliO [Geomonas sp. RF6]|uniref:flagellar biosynthetic protein FliO n=1 Tax=Geomonas sp. RF6 TaxID=2897342 RepID=UPI001E44DD04|nr:flagellar biosynthetic protein FliO [Geomonas sp. RF6]UFS72340.1 flagellar biosynthetic protein FliO [Geomonas sp. RF6]